MARNERGSDGARGLLSRRRVLGGATAAAATGGTLWTLGAPPAEEHAFVNANWEGSAAGSGRLAGMVTLGPGQFTGRAFTLPGAATVEIVCDLQSGPAVDLYTLERSAFEAYREGDPDVTYLLDLSRQGIRDGRMRGEVGGGEYVLIVDNTDTYGTTPGGASATVGVTVSATAT